MTVNTNSIIMIQICMSIFLQFVFKIIVVISKSTFVTSGMFFLTTYSNGWNEDLLFLLFFSFFVLNVSLFPGLDKFLDNNYSLRAHYFHIYSEKMQNSQANVPVFFVKQWTCKLHPLMSGD